MQTPVTSRVSRARAEDPTDGVAVHTPVASRVSRARVTNGVDLLPNVDGRSAIARRYRDLCCAIFVDQGGAERLSQARTQLIRRFAAASCLAENLEAKLVNGEAVDIQEHALLTSSLVRLAQRIGIDRRAINIVPELRDYLGALEGEGEAAE